MEEMAMARFLVGLDGSEGSRRTALFAARRARAEGAELVLAHVVDWSPYEVLTPEELSERPVEHRKEVEQALATIVDPVAEAVAEPDLAIQKVVRHGHTAESLIDLVEELSVDQVFTGRRGRSRVASLLFGSVSGALVQICPVPITVVP
jgi:nucleotide-binding universal stress UspA family protein